MKCLILIIISAFLLFTTSSCSFDNLNSDKLSFKEVDGGYALYRYKGSSEKSELTIPNEYKGMPVLEILDFAISNVEYLNTINIGSHIKKISEWGIINCSALEKINVSSDNPYFCDINGVLYDKAISTILVFPNSAGQSFTMPETVVKIENNAFYQCKNLKTIYLSSNLKSIGDKAFIKCSSLEKISLPNKLESIGVDAFSFCDSLTELVIPASLSFIGDYAFFSQDSLIQEVVIQRENEEGMVLGKDWLPNLKYTVNTKPQLVFRP